MSFDPAIRVTNIGKCYQIYAQPQDRLKQFLWGSRRQYYREFWALRNVSFEIMPGEVLGVIGRNGAGKSSLLQLICGTLTPTIGEVTVKGRVAALLELGAGFNPEFTGRENVFMSAAIMGLSQDEIAECYEGIVDFSGIRNFIDQPVKTYSSGMYVRLAFAVAISVEPEILVIDEALSVGDVEFSRKSFERIMALKDAGVTILFCSHALYQVEALCSRAIWLDAGCIRAIGPVADVVVAYSESLDFGESSIMRSDVPDLSTTRSGIGARVLRVGLHVSDIGADGGRLVTVVSCRDTLSVSIDFAVDLDLPMPSVGVLFTDRSGRNIASVGSHIDGVSIPRREGGGRVVVSFPDIPLLKGDYVVQIFLLCERGINCYEHVMDAGTVRVRQANLELGVVSLPHIWSTE